MLLYQWLQAAAKKHQSENALVYRDTYLSWRGLAHRVDRRATELEGMGILPGDWVGVMLGNVPEFTILALAIAKIKGVVVPLDPTTGSRELDFVLSAAPIRGLITRPRGGESHAAGSPEAKKVKRARTAEARRRLQGTLLTCSIYQAAAPNKQLKDAQAVLFTADSAGDFKGVVRDKATLLAITGQIAKSLSVTQTDRILAAVPLYQAYGFDFAFALALRLGATLYLEDELSDRRIMRILREHEANFVPGTPEVYEPLCHIPTARPLKTKKARFLVAEAHQAPDIFGSFKKRYGIKLAGCYHTAEAGPVAVDVRGQATHTVGKPFDKVKIRAGSKGAPGPIWVQSKGTSRLFVGAVPAKAAKGEEVPVGGFDAKGWFRTGDLGTTDKAGRLIIKGREDDLVKVGGKRVALGEVEACIETLPRVSAAKAVVVEDPMSGPMVIAQVVARGRVKEQDIIDHCARNLAPYKVPRRVQFTDTL